MDGLEDRIELTRVVDGAAVSASIVKLTRGLAQSHIDGKWWDIPGASSDLRKQENDNHWRWAKQVGELRNDRWHEAVAVQTLDGELQGAILYRLNTTSFTDADKGAIYVQGLATAPRNRPWLVPNPLYRGVGGRLMLRAISHSYLIGFHGVVNLEAFDQPQTVNYYLERGFEIVGHNDGLPQLEISSSAAMAWLRKEGYDI